MAEHQPWCRGDWTLAWTDNIRKRYCADRVYVDSLSVRSAAMLSPVLCVFGVSVAAELNAAS